VHDPGKHSVILILLKNNNKSIQALVLDTLGHYFIHKAHIHSRF